MTCVYTQYCRLSLSQSKSLRKFLNAEDIAKKLKESSMRLDIQKIAQRHHFS